MDIPVCVSNVISRTTLSKSRKSRPLRYLILRQKSEGSGKKKRRNEKSPFSQIGEQEVRSWC